MVLEKNNAIATCASLWVATNPANAEEERSAKIRRLAAGELRFTVLMLKTRLAFENRLLVCRIRIDLGPIALS